jgi:hypothetical protein
MSERFSSRRWWLSFVMGGLLLAGAGDASRAARDKEPKDDVVERRGFQIVKPEITLEPVAEYPASRQIGGVRIELSRIPFRVKPMYFVTVQERTSKWEGWTGVRIGKAAPVWIGAMPYYDIEPEGLRFQVRITNQLGRVLRLESVALQFMKDGEALYTDATANDLRKVIILPEKSWEGVIVGPSLEAFGLKEYDARTSTGGKLKATATTAEGVLLVGLYDVITELDEASNPTQRSNFEWVFAYTAQAVPEEAEALRWKAKLTAEQAAAIVGERPAVDVAGTLPGN